jgi:DNA-binding IclR family transcriptional regulator
MRLATSANQGTESERDLRTPEPVSTVAAPMVDRAFRLLDQLAAAEEGQTLSELARALSMSKGSLHGLLKTLQNRRIVEQGEDRRYVLGPHLHELAQSYVRGAGLRHVALPIMQRLAESTGQTIILGRVEQDCVRVLERAQAAGLSLGLHISAERGTRVHLLAGATGRVVLASWPHERREQWLRNRSLPQFTERSITDPERFLAAVEEAEQLGIGEERGEYLIGVNAVAAPIHGPDGDLVALLWIIGFSARFNGETFALAGQNLHEAAKSISRALGASALRDTDQLHGSTR